MMRPISDQEREGVLLMVNALSDESVRDAILADLNASQVEDETPDRSRVIFHIEHYARPAYRGQHPYPVEGQIQDIDGARIEVILYADENGRLFELELIRTDGAAIIHPDWTSLKVY